MKRTYPYFSIAVFTLMVVTSAWAAMESAAKSLEGTVTSINNNTIIVKSKLDADRVQRQEVPQQVSLEINDQTRLNDLASLKDIKAGDQVSVNYTEEGSRKVATMVARQEGITEQGAGAAAGTSDPTSRSTDVLAPNRGMVNTGEPRADSAPQAAY